MSSRLGYCRTFHKPSSRLSFCAAKLNRADCASQGLISCSSEMVFIGSPVCARRSRKGSFCDRVMTQRKRRGWGQRANVQSYARKSEEASGSAAGCLNDMAGEILEKLFKKDTPT